MTEPEQKPLEERVAELRARGLDVSLVEPEPDPVATVIFVGVPRLSEEPD